MFRPVLEEPKVSRSGEVSMFLTAPGRLRGMERSQNEGVGIEKLLTNGNQDEALRNFPHSFLTVTDILAAQGFKFCLF